MNMPIGLRSATQPGALRLDSSAQSLSLPALATPYAVLVVDDEVEVLEELASSLGRRGLTVLSAGSADAALAVLRGRPDIAALVSDIRMPGMDGLALAEAALRGRGEAEALEVVLVTGYAASAHGMAAARIGAFGLLQKPMRGADLARMVQDALSRATLRRGSARPSWSMPPIFGLPDRPAFAQEAEPLNPTRAAEALLHTLAQRLDAAGNGIGQIARDLRGPLGDLLRAAPQVEAAAGEPRRLLALLDDLMDIAALEAGTAQVQRAPISAHGLLGAVATRLGQIGLRCGRRIILQPDADPAFMLDANRLVRAMHLLAGLAMGSQPAAALADLAIDAGGGQARLDLVIRPAEPGLPQIDETETSQRLPIAIARRLAALQGGRLDAWPLPEGGLRARLLLRGG